MLLQGHIQNCNARTVIFWICGSWTTQIISNFFSYLKYKCLTELSFYQLHTESTDKGVKREKSWRGFKGLAPSFVLLWKGGHGKFENGSDCHLAHLCSVSTDPIKIYGPYINSLLSELTLRLLLARVRVCSLVWIHAWLIVIQFFFFYYTDVRH